MRHLLVVSCRHFGQLIGPILKGQTLLLLGTTKMGSKGSLETSVTNYTSQQDFGTRKVYFVSNVTFHAESKYAIKIFPSPTVFVQWPF